MRNETGENENVKAFDKIQNPFMIAHQEQRGTSS